MSNFFITIGRRFGVDYLLTYIGDLTCAFRLMRISHTGPARPFNVFSKVAKVVCATQEGGLGVAYIEFGNFEIWNRCRWGWGGELRELGMVDVCLFM